MICCDTSVLRHPVTVVLPSHCISKSLPSLQQKMDIHQLKSAWWGGRGVSAFWRKVVKRSWTPLPFKSMAKLLPLPCWYKHPTWKFPAFLFPSAWEAATAPTTEQRLIIHISKMLGSGSVPRKVSKKIPFQYIKNKPVERRCQILISLAIFFVADKTRLVPRFEGHKNVPGDTSQVHAEAQQAHTPLWATAPQASHVFWKHVLVQINKHITWRQILATMLQHRKNSKKIHWCWLAALASNLQSCSYGSLGWTSLKFLAVGDSCPAGLAPLGLPMHPAGKPPTHRGFKTKRKSFWATDAEFQLLQEDKTIN